MSPLLGRPAVAGRDAVVRAGVLSLATLSACAPLSLIFEGPQWWLIPLAAVLIVLGAAAGTRALLPIPPLVPLVHLVSLLLLVALAELSTGVLDPQHGVVTGSQGLFAEQFAVLRSGVLEIGAGYVPVGLDGPGTVVVTLAAGLVVILLDLLFIDMGWHTPTGFLLIGVMLAPAVMYPSGIPWWTAAGPLAGGLLVFATRTLHADSAYLEGDERPQTGPLSRRTAMTLGTSGAVLGVLMATPLVAALVPRTSRQLVPLDIDMINAWRGVENPGFGSVMIDDSVSVRRGLLRRAETEVLRYTTDASSPEYLRLYTLTEFEAGDFRLPEGLTQVEAPASFSDVWREAEPPEDEPRYDVTITDLTSWTIPVPPNIGWFEVSPEIGVDRVGTVEGTLLVGPRAKDLSGGTYSVVSRRPGFGAEELRQVVGMGDTDAWRDDIPAVVSDLAEEIFVEADAANLYEAAQAFVSFFHTEFQYSLTVRSQPGEDPIEAFLEDRIGYCEQFAATFALMIRSMGGESRVGVGFTAGTRDGEEWVVTSHNAHAWPEVWFGPEYGWVRFEPTPPAAGSATRNPPHEDTGDQEEPVPETPEPTEEETTEPEAPSTEAEVPEGASTAGPEEDVAAGAGDGQKSADGDMIARGAGILGILGASSLAALVVLRSRMRSVAREDLWDAAAGSRRDEGLLAWAEIDRAVAARSARTHRAATVPWAGDQPEATLDRSMPPRAALLRLLTEISEDEEVVTPRHREAADAIGAALSDARYAPTLGPGSRESDDTRGSLREDTDLILDLLRRH